MEKCVVTRIILDTSLKGDALMNQFRTQILADLRTAGRHVSGTTQIKLLRWYDKSLTEEKKLPSKYCRLVSPTADNDEGLEPVTLWEVIYELI